MLAIGKNNLSSGVRAPMQRKVGGFKPPVGDRPLHFFSEQKHHSPAVYKACSLKVMPVFLLGCFT